MNKPPDPQSSYYKTIKTSLKSIVTDHSVIRSLNEAVIMAHRISIHTLQFLKLYVLHSYETTHQLPNIDRSLIINVMKTLAPKQTKVGRPPKDETIELKEKLHQFYIQHYRSLMTDEDAMSLSYERMTMILEYLVTNVETAYFNNVKQHFITCVERYINVVAEKITRVNAINNSNLSMSEKKDQIAKLCRLLRDLKTDILSLNSELRSPILYHDFILQTRVAILPNKGSYQNNSIHYDLQCYPQEYLLGMFRMIQTMEAKGVSIMNLFPLRTSIIPKYIRIDTAILVNLLVDYQKHGYTKTHCVSRGNLVKLQNQIWSFFFKTQKRCFYNNERHQYRFNHMIETDGVGCSIQLVRQDLFGQTRMQKSIDTSIQEKYIDDVGSDILQSKRLVAIDPNLSDLLYCVTKNDDQVIKLRYTQNQRRKETKSKKYLRIIEGFKQDTTIDSQTVLQWESELSQYNHKTLIFEQFRTYIRQKNLINSRLLIFYEGLIYRKLRFNGYVNRQRSESRFMNRFRQIFGSSNDVVIGIGDYEQHQHRKFKEPVKGKGFRQMFRRAGYQHVYLVDEHRTSCRCHSCKNVIEENYVVGGECRTFRICKNPRPWRKEKDIIRHGLLMCQTCKKLWCRDTNASLNILEIMNSVREGAERPKYLQRGKVSFSNTTSVLPTTFNFSMRKIN
jgi:transposase